MILGNLAFTVLAKVGFELSAASSDWRGFWFWQIVSALLPPLLRLLGRRVKDPAGAT